MRFTEAIDAIIGSQAKFSKRNQLCAERVRRLQHIAGFLSKSALIYSVMTNDIRDNPTSKKDNKMCDKMLGRSVYEAKSKRTMRQSNLINTSYEVVEVPSSIITYYGSVQLAADVLDANDVQFLTSVANHLHHRMSKGLDNMQVLSLELRLKNIMRSYAIRGFSAGITFLDIQFKCA